MDLGRMLPKPRRIDRARGPPRLVFLVPTAHRASARRASRSCTRTSRGALTSPRTWVLPACALCHHFYEWDAEEEGAGPLSSSTLCWCC